MQRATEVLTGSGPHWSCRSSFIARVRHISSSPKSTLLFGRTKTPTLGRLFQDLHDAEKKDRLDLVVKVYPSLRNCIRNTIETPDVSLSRDRLLSAMKFVANSGRFSLLLDMFKDLPRFGISPEGVHHEIVLQGMANMVKTDKALAWIRQMNKVYGLTPSKTHWNIVLGSYCNNHDLEGLKVALALMKESGTSCDIQTYNIIISAYCHMLDMEGARKTLYEMKKSGIGPNLSTDALILVGFVKSMDLESAREVQERLALALEDLSAMKQCSETAEAVSALIQYKCASSGFASGFRLAERFKNEGFQFDRLTLDLLASEAARSVHSVEEAVDLVEQLEKAMRVRSTARTWSILMESILSSTDGLDECLKLYEEARFRDVKSDSNMALVILSALFEQGSSKDKLVQAKRIYADLKCTGKGYHSAPDVKVYSLLLKACADLKCSDIDFSNVLVSDMQRAGIRLSTKALTWHAVAKIQACEDHIEAFEAYESFRDLDPSALTQETFNIILKTYLYTQYPPDFDGKQYYANSVSVYKILTDMRRLGKPPTAKTYSILLHYFSKYPAADLKAVVQTHAFIKLENSFDPDTGLFNTLMMAYGRLGAFEAALRIWQSLKSSRAIGGPASADNHSVSIILDMLGWSSTSHEDKVGNRHLTGYDQQTLRSTWETLRWEEENLPGSIKLNRKNWESYMEALCRHGAFDDAEKLVFDEMMNVAQRGVGVGTSTIETLLKFSRRAKEGTWERLRARVQATLPELWDSVKDVAAHPNVNLQSKESRNRSDLS